MIDLELRTANDFRMASTLLPHKKGWSNRVFEERGNGLELELLASD